MAKVIRFLLTIGRWWAWFADARWIPRGRVPGTGEDDPRSGLALRYEWRGPC